jgi:hypothetical protein
VARGCRTESGFRARSVVMRLHAAVEGATVISF